MGGRASVEWLLLLGAGVMQLPAIDAARRCGLQVAVADVNAIAPGVARADAFYHTDLKDGETLLQNARELAAGDNVLRGVFTAGTDFAFMVSWLTDRLGLPGHSYEAALNATEKHRMRARLKEAGVPVPNFEWVTNGAPHTVSRVAEGLGFPLVVKPVDSMGAREVRLVASTTELRSALKAAIECSRSGRAVAEGVIEGRELSLDALVWDGRIEVTGVADRHVRFRPRFIEIGHTMPTVLCDAERIAVEQTFRDAIRALGLTHGAAKGDIFLTAEGPVVGEIAARLSGGYMSGWTYPLSTGVDLTQAAIRLAIGEEPCSLSPAWAPRVVSERAIISIPGRLRESRGLTEARRSPGIEELFWSTAVGDEVTFPRNNVEKCGNLIATGPTRTESQRRVEAALDKIEVVPEAGERKTWEWLFVHELPETQWAFSADLAFPPDAVSVAGPTAGLTGGARTTLSLQFPRKPNALVALPGVASTKDRDWHGRRLSAVVERLRERYELVECEAGEGGLELLFWQAVMRGSLQGGAFVLDTIREYPERVKVWLEEL